MTQVLRATDALRLDHRLSMALDDSQINYSSGPTDWKTKYNEVADMLAETRAELDEFHTSSKELEDELIKEIDRTEKAQQDLIVKVARTETERDEWKSKFMSLQTNHNTTTTSLQRELDTLRQEHQKVKVELRELEMGNDDLERNERAVSSSLADIESKYSRALEEKILLEHELLDKANLEEECQRLKDELRDANVEISILKDQVTAAQSTSSAQSSRSSTIISDDATPSLFPDVYASSTISNENLLTTPPPADLQLSDLSSTSELPLSADKTPTRPKPDFMTGQSALLQRAGFQPNQSAIPSPSSTTRSKTFSSLASSSRIPPFTPTTRPTVVTRNPSAASTSSTASGISSTTSKSKGVQMVTEMRARVKILEQKIHTRVPRLRMGSVTGRPNGLDTSTMSPSMASPLPPVATTPVTTNRSTSLRARGEDRNKPVPVRRSADIESKTKRTPATDTSGWVLIMEDSPSPVKDTETERRRVSSPFAPTTFRPNASTSATSPTVPNDKGASLFKSTMNTGLRRPQSRLSGASLSTTATTSSIPTPTSRPSTPTFLPIPAPGLYGGCGLGINGMMRSMGPVAYSQPKRVSLGSSAATTPSPPSDAETRRERPISYSSRFDLNNDGSKVPKLPSLHSNVTMRPPNKLPGSGSSDLSKSRIGRPNAGRRRSSPLLDTDVSNNSNTSSRRPGADSELEMW